MHWIRHAPAYVPQGAPPAIELAGDLAAVASASADLTTGIVLAADAAAAATATSGLSAGSRIVQPLAGATITAEPVFVDALLTAGATDARLLVNAAAVALDNDANWRFVYKPTGTGAITLAVRETLGGGGTADTPDVVVTIASVPTVPLPVFATPDVTEATVTISGSDYDIRNGNAYVAGTSTFVAALYDPAYYANSFTFSGGTVYRLGTPPDQFAVVETMAEGFEGISTIGQIVGPANGWGALTLQEPAAPTGAEAVALGNSVLAGGAFIENRVEPSTTRARFGTQSLRVYAVAGGGTPSITKASLGAVLMHAARGETLYGRCDLYIESGTPLGLIDFECTFAAESPGIRLLLNTSRVPRFELKAFDKPTWSGTNAIPAGQWVRLDFEIGLHESAGVLRLWIDGVLEISATGAQTLPLASLLYDRVQIGITANAEASASLVWFDGWRVQKSPIEHASAFVVATATADLSVGDATMAAAATAVASSAADLTTGIPITAAASSVAAAAADLTTAIALAADASALAAASGDLSTAIVLGAAASGVATATTDLTTAIVLGGDAAGVAASAADLTTAIVLVADAAAVATATADLSGGAATMAAAATATASSTADLTTAIVLVADVSAVASASADLSGGAAALAADVSAIAAASADLTTAIVLVADASATATASGDLGGAPALQADATATATAAGDLSTAIVLAADATATASASASLDAATGFAADALVEAIASGTLTTAIRLQGAAAAEASVTGELLVGALVAAYSRRSLSRAGARAMSRGGPIARSR